MVASHGAAAAIEPPATLTRPGFSWHSGSHFVCSFYRAEERREEKWFAAICSKTDNFVLLYVCERKEDRLQFTTSYSTLLFVKVEPRGTAQGVKVYDASRLLRNNILLRAQRYSAGLIRGNFRKWKLTGIGASELWHDIRTLSVWSLNYTAAGYLSVESCSR